MLTVSDEEKRLLLRVEATGLVMALDKRLIPAVSVVPTNTESVITELAPRGADVSLRHNISIGWSPQNLVSV